MNARWRFQNAHEVPRLKTLPGFYIFPSSACKLLACLANYFLSFHIHEPVTIGCGTSIGLMTRFIRLFLAALRGSESNFTSGSINRAIFLLSVPMILEMVMESLFAVVDVFFVAKISTEAIATVGLTESVLTLVYSIAIGLSTAATALVARRVGEQNQLGAGRAVGQVILVSVVLAIIMGVPGFLFADTILRLMGGNEQLIANGVGFTRMIFISSPAIILLYTLSGCLRGAGDASMAMRSLWLANGINILLCPVFIFGLGPFPEMGVLGSAVATTTGRTIGVIYQLIALSRKKGAIQLLQTDMATQPGYYPKSA